LRPANSAREAQGHSPRIGEKPLLIAFGALIAFGCLLRFWKLTDDGLWYDELWTVVAASDRPFTEMYREWMHGDPHPPGYFLFYFVWLALFPSDELWARIPNALAGVLTVLYLLVGARRVLSRDERIYAAALAAFSYLYIFYAVNVKQYSATILLVTVATITYLEIGKQGRLERGKAIVLGATCVCLAYLDHFAMAYSWCLLALLAVQLRGRAPDLRRLRTVATTLAAAYLPIAYFLYFPLLYSGNSEQSEAGLFVSELLPSLFFADRPFVAGFLLVLAAVLLGGGRSTWSKLRTGRNRQVLTVLSTFAACLLVLSLALPLLVVRYFIVLFPVTLIGVAILAAAAFPLARGWRAALPLVFFARAAVVDFRAVDGMQRQQWDDSVDLVLASAQPDDVVAVLGSNPDRSMLDYLEAGDYDAALYRQNLEFYEYYFRRRGADDVAARLELLEPTMPSVSELASRYRSTGKTVYILAGHQIQLDEEALWTLEQSARNLETTWLYSTIVYEITF
jgi:hypothetical protein